MIAMDRRADGLIFVGGEFRPPNSARTESVVDKATDREIGRFAVGDSWDVAAAVTAASSAQVAWAAATHDVRSGLLRRVARLIEENASEYEDLIVRETGGIRRKATREVGSALRKLYESAALAARPDGEVMPSQRPGKLGMRRHYPVGIVAAITPWNFPLNLAMRAIAPALALGNTVVLKPSSLTPIAGGQLIAELFQRAGAPPGVINVVTGSGVDVGEPLAAHPGVAMIHFTGSTDTGRRLAEIAARHGKRVELELGGNNALVVLDDADIETASACGAWAGFEYQGQICQTAGRHIVMEAVHDRYVEAIARRARRVVVGDPLNDGVGLGPLINSVQRDRVDKIVQTSVRMGARLIEGGAYEGNFYRPTVLDNVTDDMPAFTEEIFGPVAPVTVVHSEPEALRLVNSQRNLVSAVYTADLLRGLAFAEQVDSDLVHVNDAMGRPTGEDDLLIFTRPKWIGLQRSRLEFPF